jgi:adenylate cyclase
LSSKPAVFLVGMLFIGQVLLGQDQKVADNLLNIYNNGGLNQTDKLEILRQLSFNEVNDLDKAIGYADTLINLAEKTDNFLYLHRGYLQRGNSNRMLGNLQNAIDDFIKSSRAAKEIEYAAGEGSAYMSIADTYSIIGNHNNAEDYYLRSIEILRSTRDTVTLATALLNAGDEYFNHGNYDKALGFFQESGEIFTKMNYQVGGAYNLGNIGMVYAELGKDELALSNINSAISILEELQDYYPISVYLTYMADIYADKKDFEKAFEYANRSLKLAQEYNLKDQISDSSLKLSELNESAGNYKLALSHFKEYLVYRDSVKNLETIQQMADLRTEFELSKKQVEIDLLEQKRKTQRAVNLASGIGGLGILAIAFGLYRRNRFINRTKRIIEKEKERSDNLLLNILPAKTAEELKVYGKVKSHRFDSVSVLFTDFQGFTAYSKNLSPEELVETVDFYFSKFDEIIERHNLEKIKTIGDAYMCVGGLSFSDPNHAKNTTAAALKIIDFVNSKKEMDIQQKPFHIRIGINSGPVVAGVVGSKKFAYDIWGDTVNIASRMESCSKAGKLNISENTYELVKDYFNCEYRGEIEAKNRGKLKMYFVNGSKKTIRNSIAQPIGSYSKKL